LKLYRHEAKERIGFAKFAAYTFFDEASRGLFATAELLVTFTPVPSSVHPVFHPVQNIFRLLCTNTTTAWILTNFIKGDEQSNLRFGAKFEQTKLQNGSRIWAKI